MQTLICKLLFVTIFCSLGCLISGKYKSAADDFSDGVDTPYSDFENFHNSGRLITGDNCGLNTVASGRIVGGKAAVHGEFPFMISIHIDLPGDFIHICGGAILNKNWIVTAAHCFKYSVDPENYRVYAGIHQLSNKTILSAQTIRISSIFLHPRYDIRQHLDSDIALLKTAEPLNIAGSGGYINSICLPTTDDDPTGLAKVIGWGHTQHQGDISDTLLAVTIPLIDRRECSKLYSHARRKEPYVLSPSMICAGKDGRDSCQGDSGGPLFTTSPEGRATLIGITSHGKLCGSLFPGKYTKVSSYLPWIHEITYLYS